MKAIYLAEYIASHGLASSRERQSVRPVSASAR
jgi:hypothetical protein